MEEDFQQRLCFCKSDFDFAIPGIFFESGSEPDITTKGILLVDKGDDVVKLFEKLVDLKLYEPNEVTIE